jgi:hypothetical protein
MNCNNVVDIVQKFELDVFRRNRGESVQEFTDAGCDRTTLAQNLMTNSAACTLLL